MCYFFSRTRGKYGEGDKEERFPYVMALVFSMCAVNYVFAWYRLDTLHMHVLARLARAFFIQRLVQGSRTQIDWRAT